MKKVLKIALLLIVLVPLLFWAASIVKCEILTFQYGEQFEEIYKENTMMGEIDYLKILNYSDSSARVYYVSKNRSGGDILIFAKKNGQWFYDRWETTVWSKMGSADGFVWPYIR